MGRILGTHCGPYFKNAMRNVFWKRNRNAFWERIAGRILGTQCGTYFGNAIGTHMGRILGTHCGPYFGNAIWRSILRTKYIIFFNSFQNVFWKCNSGTHFWNAIWNVFCKVIRKCQGSTPHIVQIEDVWNYSFYLQYFKFDSIQCLKNTGSLRSFLPILEICIFYIFIEIKYCVRTASCVIIPVKDCYSIAI